MRSTTRIAGYAKGGAGAEAEHGATKHGVRQMITERSKLDKANHLTDVASSDQHTVKPWLDVKLDFAAPVVDPLAKVFLSLAVAWI